MEWSLVLWVKGYIKVEMIRNAQQEAAKGKMPKIDFPKKKNARGVETTAYMVFNASDWSLKTASYLKSITALKVDDMRTIIDLSRALTKNCKTQNKEQDEDADDSRGCIVETTYNSSEIETDESGDERAVPGWGDPEEEDDSRSGPHVPRNS